VSRSDTIDAVPSERFKGAVCGGLVWCPLGVAAAVPVPSSPVLGCAGQSPALSVPRAQKGGSRARCPL
jgi:hypothetical protein